MNTMLQTGNSKLSTSVGIFNLPEGKTCPGRTPFCAEVCYAKRRRCKKGGRNDKVSAFRESNRLKSLSDSFVNDIVREIRFLGVSKVRIHESGDFYSQEYLDKWIRIAERCPDVTFLAYTRCFDILNFSDVPSNMIVYHSFDPTSRRTPRADERAAFLVPSGSSAAEVAPGYFVCPAKIMKKKRIHNYCGTLCKRCWTASPRIAFAEH
jgi:hypothetical protein